jgi:hypothetical protein
VDESGCPVAVRVCHVGQNEFVSLPWKRNAVVRFARNSPLTDKKIIEQVRYGFEKFFLRQQSGLQFVPQAYNFI